MSAHLKPRPNKSTTVRTKIRPIDLTGYCHGARGRAPAAGPRDGQPDRFFVVPARLHHADGRPTRFERVIVPAFAAIVACYAAAVIARVIMAYGA
jgi:hypothetical protein